MPTEVNPGDTAWVLTSAALVMLMTPALGFFYGGLVRRKNVLVHASCRASSSWRSSACSGCSGATAWPSAPTRAASSAACDWVGLNGVGQDPNADYAATVPALGVHGLPDDVRGHHPRADHGRVRRAQALQGVRPLHPAVGDASSTTRSRTGSGAPAAGCACLGALDFAGGTVVHISSASRRWSPRSCSASASGFGKEPMEPHDLTMRCSARRCSGSAGSASTRVARSPRAAWRPPRSSPPTPPPRWRR